VTPEVATSPRREPMPVFVMEQTVARVGRVVARLRSGPDASGADAGDSSACWLNAIAASLAQWHGSRPRERPSSAGDAHQS
jgi:hypothetical protein